MNFCLLPKPSSNQNGFRGSWSAWALVIRHPNLHILDKKHLWRLVCATDILNSTQIQQILRKYKNFVFKFSMTQNHFCQFCLHLFGENEENLFLLQRCFLCHYFPWHELYKVFLRKMCSEKWCCSGHIHLLWLCLYVSG